MPNPMFPYTRTDRLVADILGWCGGNRWFQATWRTLGYPPIAVRMPMRTLPNGERGYRVLRLRLRPAEPNV